MTFPISRRATLSALAGTAASLSLARPAWADPTLLRVSIVPIFDVAPMYAANAQGYFAAENIAVTTQSIESGVFGIPALVAGAYDVAYSNSTSVLSAIQQGLDLRIIIEGSLTPGAGVIFIRKGDAFRTGKDFEGHSFAVNGIGNVMWMVARSWIKATGGDPEKVNFREVPLPQILDAIKNRQIDGAIVLDPFMTIALGEPNTFEVVDNPFKRVYPGGATAFWVVTGQTATKRPEVVRAFVRAYRRGAAWTNANLGKQAYLELVSGYTHLHVALIRKMQLFPTGTIAVTPASVAELQKLMVENGLLKKPLDLRSKIFT